MAKPLEQPISDRSAKPERERELTTFSPQEIEAIAGVIFGKNKSTLDTFALWAGGGLHEDGPKELEGYQKVLLAPGNAVEGLVRSVWEFNEDPGGCLVRFGKVLFDRETYKNVAQMVGTIADTEKRKVLQEALSKGWGNLGSEEKTAFVTEIIFSNLMGGGFSKLEKVVPAAKLVTIARTIEDTASVAQKSLLAEEIRAGADTEKRGAASIVHDVAFAGIGTGSSGIPRIH